MKYSFEVQEVDSSNLNRASEKAFDEKLIAINEEWNEKTRTQREHHYVQVFSESIAENLMKREEYDQMEAQRIAILKERLLSMKVSVRFPIYYSRDIIILPLLLSYRVKTSKL